MTERASRHSLGALLLVAIVAMLVFVACVSEPTEAPASATQPTAKPPAPVATAVAQAEATVIATHANSGTLYCGRLCQTDFWLTANVAILDAELARGAQVDARDGDGRTPLHYAARLADISVVEALLERDADIDAIDYEGYTPLHVAATNRKDGHRQDAAAIALLLERGAEPNGKNE